MRVVGVVAKLCFENANVMRTHERANKTQQSSMIIDKKTQLTSMAVGPRKRAIVVRAVTHGCEVQGKFPFRGWSPTKVQ